MRTRSQSRNNFPQQEASPAIVEPLRIELPFLEDQFQEDPPVDPPEVSMADNRTMAELLQAPTEVVAKVSTSSSTPVVSSEVSKIKDIVRALLLDKKNQSSAPAPSYTPAPVKAIEPNYVTCGGTHSYQNCPATSRNVYRDNIQEYVSQAAVENYNQGNTSFRPQLVANQIRPPSFPPHQNNQNNFNWGNNFNQNRGGYFNQSNFNQGGTLPSNTITNPKEDLKGITTRSGVAYQGPTIPTPSKVVKQGTEPVVAPVSVLIPNMKPSILYPSRRDNERRRDQANEQIEKFYEIFKDMSFEISFTDALILMPKFASTLKALIGNKEKLSEMARTPINEHCSAVILNKLPRKLGDPDKFLIPCEFPGMDECLALANLGASINLMPLSVWEGLSLLKLTLTCMTLELADRSVSKPIGIAKDVSVKEANAFLGLEDDPNSLKINPFYYDPEGNILLLEAILNSEPLPPLPNHKQYMPSFKKELKVCEAKTVKSSVDEPPEVELKDLPPHLEYAFLKGDNKLPVIIAKELGDEEKSALIKRVCIDYRKLNEATRKDHFPLPFMDQMLERLAWNEYYFFLDGFSRYFQIPIDPRDQEKTTFTCPYETFAYRRMPFGLCNVPGTFQRCMLAIFHDMVEKTMEVFMDDFSIFRNSFENCLSRLDKMLQRCEDTNLCLNWEKSHFMVKEGIVLGHKISKNGIEVDRAKVDVITKLPHPTTVKGIRSFLGHVGFYRRFIQNFSKISRPMTHLLEKNTLFIFSEDCIKAFHMLNKKLTEAPILITPNWDLPFELMCDASDFAIGAVLRQ
nr:reverse transcriptase domain-containing protein [Tanacetum cinerariifolium]